MVSHKYLTKVIMCGYTKNNPANKEEKYYNHNWTDCVDTTLHQTIQNSP